MFHFLFIGFTLGFSAGFSPGPLSTLVITETLRYNVRAGMKVALAPILTDIPIVACSIFIIARVSQSNVVLAIISFCGAVFIARMGILNIRISGSDIVVVEQNGQSSIRKGIITNFLSPHPYIFWLTIGVPVISRAIRQDFIQVLVFLLSFYFLLVGSKVMLAFLVGKSRRFLQGNIYVYIMRSLGVVLCVLAIILFSDGVHLMLNSPVDF